MRDTRVAKPYARALYEAAVEQNALDAIITDVNLLIELSEQSEEFSQFINNPLLSPQFKSDLFQRLFADTLLPLTLNFLQLLAFKQRERYFAAIANFFMQLVDEAAGRVVAKVTTTVPMTAEQQTRLAQQLREYAGPAVREVRLESITDKDIQGGFIVQLKDTVFDASVATQLRRLKQQLATG